MAEIHVERKRPRIWPWVVGLILLALLIWVVVEMFGPNIESTVTDMVNDTVTETPGPPAAAPRDTVRP